MKTELPFNSPLSKRKEYASAMKAAERFHKKGWSQMAMFMIEQLAYEATKQEEIDELKRIAKVIGG